MAKPKKVDETELVVKMDQAVKLVKQQVVRHLEHAGLEMTADQWTLLELVASHEGLTQKQLADAAGKDKPTVTRMLDLMLKKDWVVKEPTPGDRRSYLVLPTRNGQEVYRAGRAAAKKAHKVAWKKSDGKEMKSVQKTLNKLIKQLT